MAEEDNSDKYGEMKMEAFVQEISNFIDTIDISGCLQAAYSPHLTQKKVDKLKLKMLGAFKDEARSLMSDLFKHAHLPQKLTQLKKLEDEYRDREATWRPPGDVHVHCRSARVQEALRLKEQLDSLTQIKMMSIARLRDKLDESKILMVTSNLNAMLDEEVNQCSSLVETLDIKLTNLMNNKPYSNTL